jgi:energy-coupling factor transport system permease protein
VPLFIYAIRHTNLLAMALESRGFSLESKRSLYLNPQMRRGDYAVLIGLTLVWLGMLYLRLQGYGEVLPRL